MNVGTDQIQTQPISQIQSLSTQIDSQHTGKQFDKVKFITSLKRKERQVLWTLNCDFVFHHTLTQSRFPIYTLNDHQNKYCICSRFPGSAIYIRLIVVEEHWMKLRPVLSFCIFGSHGLCVVRLIVDDSQQKKAFQKSKGVIIVDICCF